MSLRFGSKTASLLLAVLAASGCSNQPGALTMQVTPAKAEFATHEPIVLSAKLRAGDRPVCLSKARQFRYEITRAGEKNPIAGNVHEESLMCGTGILESFLLFPYLYVFTWLDVADAAGRFHVLDARDTITQRLHLHDGAVRLPQQNSTTNVHYIRFPIDPGPGEYDVRVVLRNERAFCGDFLPLPIGWQLYNQPTASSARVVVKSAAVGQAGATPNNQSWHH